ncbi:MAG TPA: hypothetical protein VE992_07985 [Solirubrobacteraceae bacterium]|nr:hypothetical protein [Solirubrobacteraceae bacterium]
MSLLSTTAKVKVGGKATKTAAKNPGLLKMGAQATAPLAKLGVKAGPPITKLGVKATAPLAKRRARRRIERLGEAARELGETLVTYGPQAAQELGLVETPKPKRTAPRVAAGAVLGAGAMYFLEPGHGKEHREKVLSKVS